MSVATITRRDTCTALAAIGTGSAGDRVGTLADADCRRLEIPHPDAERLTRYLYCNFDTQEGPMKRFSSAIG
jgi:hypothetical protein